MITPDSKDERVNKRGQREKEGRREEKKREEKEKPTSRPSRTFM